MQIVKGKGAYPPLLFTTAFVFSLMAPCPAAGGETAEIKRDSMGVPHCYGDTPASMIYAHGYAQAEDHLEELLTLASVALGRGAEFLGSSLFDSDKVQRLMGGRRAIEANLDKISPEAFELAGAFAAGVRERRLFGRI